MQITLGGLQLQYPLAPDELKLSEWISFIGSQPQSQEQETWLGGYISSADHAYRLVAHFAEVEVEKAKTIFPFLETIALRKKFFAQVFIAAKGPWELYDLPAPQLLPNDGITFGEFIDSKMIVQAGAIAGSAKWEILQQLAAIWLRKEEEQYEEAFLHAGSERLEEMGEIPICQAIRVGAFWEALNDDCAQRFTIFGPSQVKGGRYMAKHFERWGWVNFLKGIAKTKVFDLPSSGLNSIECARKASAYDVLVFASEEKDYSEAQYFDSQPKK